MLLGSLASHELDHRNEMDGKRNSHHGDVDSIVDVDGEGTHPSEVGMQFYQDIKPPRRHSDADGLITTVDSIRKVKNARYDHVFSDELECVLEQLLSPTLRNDGESTRRETFDRFVWSCRNAEVLVVFDADLSDRGIQFLKDVRDPQHTIVLHYTGRHNPNTLYATWDRGWALAQAEADVKSGKNLWMPCDEKKKGADALYNHMRRQFPSEADRMKKITSDMAPGVRRVELADCTRSWCNQRVMVASPTADRGVNHDPKVPHFHKAYGFFGGKSITPANAAQMLPRVRKLIDREVVAVLPRPGYGALCADLHELQRTLAQNLDFMIPSYGSGSPRIIPTVSAIASTMNTTMTRGVLLLSAAPSRSWRTRVSLRNTTLLSTTAKTLSPIVWQKSGSLRANRYPSVLRWIYL